MKDTQAVGKMIAVGNVRAVIVEIDGYILSYRKGGISPDGGPSPFSVHRDKKNSRSVYFANVEAAFLHIRNFKRLRA